MRIPADDYITPEQYRRLCGYATVATIHNAIKQGRLKAYKVGRDYIIPATAILETNRTGQCIGLDAKKKKRRQEIIQEMFEDGVTPEDINGKKV
jgi:hypothetical protein